MFCYKFIFVHYVQDSASISISSEWEMNANWNWQASASSLRIEMIKRIKIEGQ